MERLFWLLLSCTLLKTATIAPESKLNNVILHTTRRVFSAHLDDALHVWTLGTDKPPRNLELFIILNLDVKAPCVLHCILVVFLLFIHIVGLRRWSWLKSRTGCWSELGWSLRWVRKDILSSEQVRWNWLKGLLDGGVCEWLTQVLIKCMLFGRSEITDERRITLSYFVRLMEPLQIRHFDWLNCFFCWVFCFSYPLYNECCVVAGQEVVIEVLLHEVGRGEVFEGEERVVVFIKDHNFRQLSKCTENLQSKWAL